MKVDMEHLGTPPIEYDGAYLSRAFRAIETALRRVDFAPVYDPEVQRTDDANPSKALYSTGGIKLDEEFVPESAEDIMPKKYVDAIDAALQEALATLDAARQAAEASLLAAVEAAQDDIDAVKADAALITYDPSGTTAPLVATDVQAAITETVEDSGLIVYDPAGSALSDTDVQAAIDALAGVGGGTPVSGTIYYAKATAGVPLLATAMNLAIDELAGTSTGTVSANIYIDPADYDGALSDLAGILDDIDSRLTTLEP